MQTIQKIIHAAFFLLIGMILPVSCKSANVKIVPNDSTEFVELFDGKTFKGWKADTNVWRIQDGCLIGEVTPSKQIKSNSFLIYTAAQPADFEFIAEYKISKEGNSGINYRSVEVTGIPYAVKGYQADIDGENMYTGQNYEERARGFLAMRGQNVIINSSSEPFVIKPIGNTDSLKSKIKVDDWNQIHLIVKGNNMKHFINGVLMSETTDNDKINRKLQGLICLQVHVSKEMKVSYKKIRIKIEKP